LWKGLFGKLAGDPNQRELDKLEPIVDEIASLEPQFEQKSNDELRALTEQFKRELALETAAVRLEIERIRRELAAPGPRRSRERLRSDLASLHAERDEIQERVLDRLLPEAFAAVREASKRTIGLSHFREQFMGGIVIHQGKIAEMKTGEGKTLAATLPAYLNALTGRGVHIVTVNDYLARRDTVWMGPIYDLLGLSVGLLQESEEAYVYQRGYRKSKYEHLRPATRREAYQADITYGTNHQFGFDYLRDNLALDKRDQVQRELNYAIVDEVDNIFIDEARTPLIISGRSTEALEDYKRFAEIVKTLRPGIDYEVDIKARNVVLTEEGVARVEQELGILNIYDEANFRYVHFLEQALNAHELYQRDRDYIVQSRRIVLIDQFTGRKIPDRKLSDGLHQAIEAKEGVPITPRNTIHATITIQNYFRMYRKLAGMTGTAMSEAEEFDKIYGLDVVAIPTHKPMIRQDLPDVVYRTEEAKWRAIVRDIEDCHRRGQPVLVGTTSVEKSERLSRMLPKHIRHHILNAKNHAAEAKIIARAGEPGAVTIATNMAGRGVDIKLGGELSEETMKAAQQILRERGIDPFTATPEQMDSAIAVVDPEYAERRKRVLEAGGLHVIGTERHEARRIDNQLRGRSGRQGDPGSSRFYLSLEDDLMRRFGGSSISSLMERVGLEDDVPIEHRLVDRAIESTQTRVEGYNFDIRKHLLDYDDVLDAQRKAIYAQRQAILDGDPLDTDIDSMIQEEVRARFDEVRQVMRGQETSATADAIWDLLGRLDQITFAIPPQDSPYRYPFSLLRRWTCFPPFSLTFLAEHAIRGAELPTLEPLAQALRSQSPPEGGEDTHIQLGLKQAILALIRRALEAYKTYLLNSIVGATFERTIEAVRQGRQEERLEYLQDSLEQQIEAYIEQINARGRTFNPRQLLQQLEKSFPLPLAVHPNELYENTERGPGKRSGGSSRRLLPLEEIKERLFTAVAISLHRSIGDRLIERVRRAIPASLRIETVTWSDLDPDAWPRFLDYALQCAYDGAKRSEIERRYLNQLDDSGGRIGSTAVLRSLHDLLDLAEIGIEYLEEILRQVVEVQYDVWAEQIIERIEKSLGEMRGDESFSPTTDAAGALIQILLDVFYVPRTVQDKVRKQVVIPGTWFPPQFLLVDLVGGLPLDELEERVIGHLQWVRKEREKTLGQQELERMAQHRLADFDAESYGDLAQYYGNQVFAEHLERPIGALEEGLRDRILYHIRLHSLEGKRLADLFAERPELLESARESLLDRAEEIALNIPIRELDQDTVRAVEDCLRASGYFDDPAARDRILAQKISQMEEGMRADLARYIGQRYIQRELDTPFGQMQQPWRDWVRDYFVSIHYFVDEEKVQRFFLSGSLNDLGDEIASAAVRFLIAEYLKEVQRRRIGDLEPRIRDQVIDFLRKEGRLTDQQRKEAFPQQTISDLEPRFRESIYTQLGRRRLGLGSSNIPSAQHAPIFDRGGDVVEEVFRYLVSVGYYSDPERRNAIMTRPLSDLGPEVCTDVRSLLRHSLRTKLSQNPMSELDEVIRDWIWTYLHGKGYFANQNKVKRLESQRLSELDGATLYSLEKRLGQEIAETLEGRKLRSLERDTQNGIWGYLRQEGLLKKSKRHQIMESTLDTVGPKIREAIVDYLGREYLAPFRGQRIQDLPRDLRDKVWGYLSTTRYVLDGEKLKSFPDKRLSDFESFSDGILSFVDEKAEELFATQPVGELPNPLRSIAEEYLVRHEFFVTSDARERFAQLRLSDLDEELRRDLLIHLGKHQMERIAREMLPAESREPEEIPFGRMPGEIQAVIQSALEQAGYFTNEQALTSYLRRLISDLDPLTREALTEHLARESLSEIGSQRIATMNERRRRLIREYLDSLPLWEAKPPLAEVVLPGKGLSTTTEGGPLSPFADRDKIASFDQRTFRDLGKTERDNLAEYLGEKYVTLHLDRRIQDVEGPLRSQIDAFCRSRNLYLDRSKLAEFKKSTLADLEADLRAQALKRLREIYEEKLLDEPISELSGPLEVAVTEYLKDNEGLPILLNSGDILESSLSELPIQTCTFVVQQLGRERLDAFKEERIRDLPSPTREILRDYLGRVIMQQVERTVMLTSINSLWINYLTDIEDVRQGIVLEAYGQRDPLVEYKRRAYSMYQELQANIRRTVVSNLFRYPPQPPKLIGTMADVQSDVAHSGTAGEQGSSEAGEKHPTSQGTRRRKRRRRKKR